MIGGIHHVALRLADPDRSPRFYGDLLGLSEARRLLDEGSRVRSIWVHAGGAVLMREREVKGAGPAAGSGHVLAFAVDDLAEWESRLAGPSVAWPLGPVSARASTRQAGNPEA